jgi:gliding motility-associated-like protein
MLFLQNIITVFMKALYLFLFSLITFSLFGQNQTKSIGFIENKGQIVDQKGKENKNVQFLLNTNGLNVQLRNSGFSYDVYETEKIPLTKKDKEFHSSNSNLDNSIQTPDYSLKYNFHRIDIDFLNSNKNVNLIPEEKSSDYDNYYNVVHAPNGITNVHKFQKIKYQNIYNNIDVVFFIPKDSTKVVEYNFIVKPGGKVSDIQLKFNGVKTDLADNKIKMNLRFGQMEETLPLSWIENGSSKKEISVNYKKLKKNIYGFDGEINSSSKTIIIDPVPIRLWGTYYGGNGNEAPNDITSDANNNVYISGTTYSLNNIATVGTHLSSIQNSAGFIAKFDINGNRIWGTYYFANVLRLKVDSNLNVYSTGNAINALNIGTIGSHQPAKNNYNDAYLIKLNSNGITEWATYYGGEGNDHGLDITFDDNNDVYLCGYTSSNQNISTPNSHQETKGVTPFATSYDAFIVKFNTLGVRQWGTYYGGNAGAYFYNCFYKDNYIYFTGNSASTNAIATPSSYQENNLGYSDGIIVKFDLNGNRIWGTYLGGENNDAFLSKGCLKNNFIYLNGPTRSTTNISTPGVFLENFQAAPNDAYSYAIIKFDIINQTKIWGTYFTDRFGDISVNNLNEVYFCGETSSNYTGIATPDGYMPIKNSYSNVYLVKLNDNGQRVWGTYYTGNKATQNARLTVDIQNNIYLYGNSNSNTTGIATANAHQTTQGSSPEVDTFLAKFLDCQSAAFVNSNSPICIGSNLELTASGGTNYNWTGPNGFVSTDQNPIIPNATAANSGQYSCAITGSTNGCDDTITLNVLVEDIIAPIPNVTTLPQINGDCNTVISTIPTALDNCSGTITATTTNPLSYQISGNYTITWNYNDGNGNTINQTQNVLISSVSLPVATSTQQFCIQENATINNIQITGQNILWYDALTGGNLLPATSILQNGITYYASQTINGCESNRVPVTITIQNTAAPTGNGNQSFCSTANATLSNVVINGSNLIWYDSQNGNTILPSSTLLANNSTYFATQTVNGCESPTRLAVTISLINTLNATNYSESICDDLNNGSETINLTNYNSNLIASTGNTFSYYTSSNGAENQISSEAILNPTNYNLTLGNQITYVRIDSPNTCHQVVELSLTLFSKPFLAINDIMPICEGASITISAGNGFDDYLWSTNEVTSTITVFQPGNYSVSVSEYHGSLTCSTTKNFSVVNSNIGTISQIISSDWTENENTISVTLSSNSVGDYEYSLNGIDYQDSNIFTGLENGEYTVYVQDKNGCGVSSDEIYLLMYPKFFTPNGDGFNDFWKIKFSENEPNLTVKIFDRYGKFIKQLGPNSIGWDGTYLEKQAPSSDYWFVVTRENGKEFRGHFSLIR